MTVIKTRRPRKARSFGNWFRATEGNPGQQLIVKERESSNSGSNTIAANPRTTFFFDEPRIIND